jgi:hypothetical protein
VARKPEDKANEDAKVARKEVRISPVAYALGQTAGAHIVSGTVITGVYMAAMKWSGENVQKALAVPYRAWLKMENGIGEKLQKFGNEKGIRFLRNNLKDWKAKTYEPKDVTWGSAFIVASFVGFVASYVLALPAYFKAKKRGEQINRQIDEKNLVIAQQDGRIEEMQKQLSAYAAAKPQSETSRTEWTGREQKPDSHVASVMTETGALRGK